MRIVSLIPSATEIISSLGHASNLVGRSHGCDFPSDIINRPILTRARCVIDGTSLEIDMSVRDILRLSTSVYEIDVDKLKALNPDIIVTQTKCEICAVSLKDVNHYLKGIISDEVILVDLHANTIEDIYSDIKKVALALNAKDRGVKLITDMKNRINLLSQEFQSKKAPTVLCLGWIEPLMTSGNWIPELVEKANAFEVLAKAGEDSYSFDFKKLIELDPEYLIVMPCGFSLTKIVKEVESLIAHKDWTKLRCVRQNKVFLTDGHFYFNRPGVRIVESLEILIDILHRNRRYKEGVFKCLNH